MIRKKTEEDYLIDSAIELFSKHSIEQVTVKDICGNCQTSRRTYYNYFKDKNDIVAKSFATLTNRYYYAHSRELTMHSLLLYMAEEVCTNAGFFRNAFSYKGQNNIRWSLVEPLQELLEDLYRNRHHKDPGTDVKDALSFFIYGILSYVEKEIESDIIPDSLTSVDFFENGMPDVVKKAFY